MLRLRTLGRIRLTDTDGRELLAGHRKELVLLAYLARHNGQTTTRAELADLLWGDREAAKARHSLRQALASLRTVLNSHLQAGPDEVRLLPGAIDTDVAELMAQLAGGRCDEISADWRADFLADAEDLGSESFRAWLEAEREGLRRQIALSFERLHAEARRQGRGPDALVWAERWAELRPHDERAQSALLDALQQSGRAAEALEQYRAIVAQLRDVVGVEPSGNLVARGEELERIVHAAVPQFASPGSAALFTPDLVARDGVLAELMAGWQSVRSGQPAVVVVEGEAGLGKTRVCTEFLRRLHRGARGPFVLQARGSGNAAPQLALVRELLTNLRSAPGLEDAANRDLVQLTGLVPTLRERFPQLAEPQNESSPLPATVAHVLGALSREAPIVVFIDDFTSADCASQEFIAAFVERLHDGRVLVLLSIEAEERTRTRALSGLYNAGRVRRIRLRPLEVNELEEVVASMIACSGDVRTALAQQLHAETAGNPLFATEMLASLVDDGRLRPDANGLWQLTTRVDVALPLPITIRDATRRRLERLSDAALRLLRAGAAADEPWDLATVGSSAGLSAEELSHATDELVARRFILEELTEHAVARYRLSHAVLRRIVRENGFGQPAIVAAVPARKRRVQPAWIAGLATAAVATFALLAQFAFRHHTGPTPTLAIGLIHDYTKGDSGSLANALPEMLATNLARVRPLQVLSRARLYEISGQLGERTLSAAAVARAAKRAGAQQLVEGELYAAPGGGYRLDLRRVALADGSVQSALRVIGRDVFSLIDEATARVADDLGYSTAAHLAEVTTHSVVAYRLYEEGLRSYYQGDMKRAAELFRSALAEDSLFALPAYYFVLTEYAGQPIDTIVEARFLSLANRGPDRERLLMRARVASIGGDPALRAIADTLTVRYPEEPDGHWLLGVALNLLGEPLEALPHLRRVIDLDSLGLRGHSPQCRACDAFAQMMYAYVAADSAAAAERITREWVGLQPAAALPWANLAHVLELSDRPAEALEARNRAAAYEPGEAYDYIFPGMLAIRSGDFESADALLRQQSRSAPPHVQREALWFLIISLRYQGRFEEALQEARRFGALEKDSSLIIPEAQVLFEMGRGREAAALFRKAMDRPRDGVFLRTPGAMARQQVWYLTHTASSLAFAGDTSTLTSLANTMEQLGPLSIFGRDRQTHHHVRGLLLAARGDHVRAAAEFRAGTNWPESLVAGYSRTNFELARELLLLGQPHEAVHSLRIALANPLEASNYYLNRSDVHALLGRAFEAVGQRDSAIAHYRWTANAWRNADPLLFARRDSIRARLAALEHASAN